MSRIRLLGGRKFNLLERAASITMVPAAAPLYPAPGLGDGRYERPVRFGSLQDDSYVQADLDLLGGTGSMDGWSGGLPGSGWTKAGTVTQDTAVKHSGVSSAKIDDGELVYLLECRPGEKVQIEAWIQGDGVVETHMNIRNPLTGAFFTPAQTWSQFYTEFASIVAFGGWASVLATFTVEDQAACRGDVAWIALRFWNSPGHGWVDDVTVTPAVDWASVHGHNVDARSNILLRSDSTPTFATGLTRATMDGKRQAFYAALPAPIYARYWRLQIANNQNSAQSGPPWLGAVVLGQSVALTTGAEFPLEIEHNRPQIRTSDAAGRDEAFSTSAWEIRTLTLRATHSGRAAFDEFHREVMWQTGQGLHPIVLAWEEDGGQESDADGVILGRVQNPWTERRGAYLMRASELVLREIPIPLFL